MANEENSKHINEQKPMVAYSEWMPHPAKYLIFVVLLVSFTAILGALSVLVVNAYHNALAQIIWKVFWVEKEANFPTFVNFALLVTASALTMLVAINSWKTNDDWRWHWLALGALFLFMSFDEAAQVHEPVGTYLTRGIDGRGFLQWTWVIAGMSIVLLLFIMGFRFLRALSGNVRRILLGAWVVYLSGALGLEMVSAFLSYNEMENFRVVTLIEETFEMAGAGLFGVAALTQIKQLDV